MDIDKKVLCPLNLLVEGEVGISVKDLGTVRDISRAGDLKGRIGDGRTNGATDVETDDHGFALHDLDHFIAHLVNRIGAIHAIGQRTDFFTFVGNVIGTVDDSSLLFRQVKVDGVPRHCQGGFFPFFQR